MKPRAPRSVPTVHALGVTGTLAAQRMLPLCGAGLDRGDSVAGPASGVRVTCKECRRTLDAQRAVREAREATPPRLRATVDDAYAASIAVEQGGAVCICPGCLRVYQFQPFEGVCAACERTVVAYRPAEGGQEGHP